MILVLPNVTIEPSNMKKKNKGTIECDKSTVTYVVGTIQCDNKTVKYEEKNKGTIECDKSTIIYDVGTT